MAVRDGGVEMKVRQRKRVGLALPGEAPRGTSRVEPTLAILYLAVLAVWVLLLQHVGVPLDAPVLLPLPGNSMLPAPILTCVIALACAGVGVCYVNRAREVHAGPLLLTVMAPIALVLLPYQWLYAWEDCLSALVAAVTTGAMLALIGLPNRWPARQIAGRSLVAAALVASAAMPWFAARRSGEAFWTFEPAEVTSATTEDEVARAKEKLVSSWDGTPIAERGRLCETYLTLALDLKGQEGERLVVEPGPAGQVTQEDGIVIASVATMATPDPTAALDGLDGIVSR